MTSTGAEPYAAAPPPGAGSLGYQTVAAETHTVGATYGEELAAAARQGVEVRGSQRHDGAFVFPGTELVNPAEVFSGPGYLAPKPRASAIAKASPALALINAVVVPVLAIQFSILALLMLATSLVPAIIGLNQTSDGRTAGRGSARAGLALSIMVGSLTLLGILVAWLAAGT